MLPGPTCLTYARSYVMRASWPPLSRNESNALTNEASTCDQAFVHSRAVVPPPVSKAYSVWIGEPPVVTGRPARITVLLFDNAGIDAAQLCAPPEAVKLSNPVCATRDPLTGAPLRPPGNAGSTSNSTPMICPSVHASRSASHVFSVLITSLNAAVGSTSA